MDGSKCIKFENKLRPAINQGINYQETHRFHTLVNECRIYDEDYRAHSAHYKSVNERKGKNQIRGNPYSAPANKGKQMTTDETNLSE